MSNQSPVAETRKLKFHLRDLTTAALTFVAEFDEEMSSRAIPTETGKRVARLTNALEMANDRARYFGLGVDYRTDRKGRS